MRLSTATGSATGSNPKTRTEPLWGFKRPMEMFDQGGFAGAVGADQAENAPRPGLQRNLVEGEFGAETPAQAGDFHGVGRVGCVHLFSLG